jgi:hypothetical protein
MTPVWTSLRRCFQKYRGSRPQFQHGFSVVVSPHHPQTVIETIHPIVCGGAATWGYEVLMNSAVPSAVVSSTAPPEVAAVWKYELTAVAETVLTGDLT